MSDLIFRPAFPDELPRLLALLSHRPLPSSAEFLVAVREVPVERILAVIPHWHQKCESTRELHFSIQHAGATLLSEADLRTAIKHLEQIAHSRACSAVRTSFSVPEDDPAFEILSSIGFEICQTDRHFEMPTDIFKARTQRIFHRVKGRMPLSWRIESIRGQDPEAIFEIVSANRLMSRESFYAHWSKTQLNRFDENFSAALFEDRQILAIVLNSRREHELHVHVDATHPGNLEVSALTTTALRYWVTERFTDEFPKTISLRADSRSHIQTANTAFRGGGVEVCSRHFLIKSN